MKKKSGVEPAIPATSPITCGNFALTLELVLHAMRTRGEEKCPRHRKRHDKRSNKDTRYFGCGVANGATARNAENPIPIPPVIARARNSVNFLCEFI